MTRDRSGESTSMISRLGSRAFFVTLCIAAAAGCQEFGAVLPKPQPKVTIEAKRTGCSEVSRSVTFKAISDSPVQSFQWFFTDGVTTSGSTTVHTFEEDGPFNVSLLADGQLIRTRVTIPVSGESDGGPDPFGDRCVPNEGELHVPNGTKVNYKTIPPASGPHYSALGVAPVAPGVYEEPVAPERWVHNLEHGYVVLLYDCDGDCPQEFLDQLEVLFQLTPVANFGQRKLVITPFEGFGPFMMAVAWDVQRDFDFFDQEGILAFYDRRVDAGPEDGP